MKSIAFPEIIDDFSLAKDTVTERPAPGKLPGISVVGRLGMETFLNVPRLPVKGDSLASGHVSSPGGGGFRLAVACANLVKYKLEDKDMVRHFATVSITGAVGDDIHGQGILGALKQNQISRGSIRRVKDHGTNVLFVRREPEGDRAQLVAGDVNMDPSLSSFTNHNSAEPEADVLLLQPSGFPLQFLENTIADAKLRGVPIVLVPPMSLIWPMRLFEEVDHLIATDQECLHLLQRPIPEEGPTEVSTIDAGQTLRRFGVKNIVIMMKARGIVLYSQEGLLGLAAQPFDFPAWDEWDSPRVVLAAAYAVALARNKTGFRAASAIEDALTAVALFFNQPESPFPKLQGLPFANLRFNHPMKLELTVRCQGATLPKIRITKV